MRERSNKSSDMLGGNRTDNEEGQRRFPPPERLRLDQGEGKGEVLPGGWAIKQTPLNHSIWEIREGGGTSSLFLWALGTQHNGGIGTVLVTRV